MDNGSKPWWYILLATSPLVFLFMLVMYPSHDNDEKKDKLFPLTTFKKIKIIDETPFYLGLIFSKIESGYDPTIIMQEKDFAKKSMNIHLIQLLYAYKKAYNAGIIKRFSNGVIELNKPYSSLTVGVETSGTFRGIIEGDTLYAPTYIVSKTLNALVLTRSSDAIAVREVIFDDEAEAWHYLYEVDGKYIVLKTEGLCVIRIYNELDNAVTDYLTVDYGWKGFSPLQAQKLTVKPIEEYNISQYLVWSIRELYGCIPKYTLSFLIRAKEIELPELYILSRLIIDTEGFIERRSYVVQTPKSIINVFWSKGWTIDIEDCKKAASKILEMNKDVIERYKKLKDRMNALKRQAKTLQELERLEETEIKNIKMELERLRVTIPKFIQV